MQDIAPRLQKSVLTDFYERVNNDNRIKHVLEGKDKQATFEDISKLSARLGKFAAESLEKNLTDESLREAFYTGTLPKAQSSRSCKKYRACRSIWQRPCRSVKTRKKASG